MEARLPGYYWIKQTETSEWEPAHFRGGWVLIHTMFLKHDTDLFQIGPKLQEPQS